MQSGASFLCTGRQLQAVPIHILCNFYSFVSGFARRNNSTSSWMHCRTFLPATISAVVLQMFPFVIMCFIKAPRTKVLLLVCLCGSLPPSIGLACLLRCIGGLCLRRFSVCCRQGTVLLRILKTMLWKLGPQQHVFISSFWWIETSNCETAKIVIQYQTHYL